MAGYFTEVRGSFDDAGHAVARVRIARLTGGSVGGGGTVVPTPVSLGNVAVTPGGALGLSVPTQAGLTYVLEKQTALGSGVWAAEQTVIGDGSVKALEGAIVGRSGFFRIRIQP
jgi:acetyltransferase-like isoleucine patch superfamily enzyme